MGSNTQHATIREISARIDQFVASLQRQAGGSASGELPTAEQADTLILCALWISAYQNRQAAESNRGVNGSSDRQGRRGVLQLSVHLPKSRSATVEPASVPRLRGK